jgi:hypothetical protein
MFPKLRSLVARVASALKRIAVLAMRPVRRLLGRALQVVEQDELQALRQDTASLTSASVESVTYLGGELRRVEERLSRIEEELAALRRLLEASGSGVEPESEEASTPAAPST